MNILQFNDRFPDERSCIDHIKSEREKTGVVCKKCFSKDHYWLNSLDMFQCKKCGFRTGLKNGTVMEDSKLPIRTWLLALTLISATKKGFSALELQRQMGHSRYETVFRLYHKVREVMGKRDSLYPLKDMVEYDEAFIAKATSADEQKKLKRGRGSQKQASVAVMAESTILEDYLTGEKDKSCRYFKMVKIGNLKAKTAEKVVKDLIDKNAVLQTDESTTFVDLADCIDTHVSEISSSIKGKFNLRWVHIAINNFHSITPTFRILERVKAKLLLDSSIRRLGLDE
jgi:Zn ribbon nucleic-acid-binding protein